MIAYPSSFLLVPATKKAWPWLLGETITCTHIMAADQSLLLCSPHGFLRRGQHRSWSWCDDQWRRRAWSWPGWVSIASRIIINRLISTGYSLGQWTKHSWVSSYSLNQYPMLAASVPDHGCLSYHVVLYPAYFCADLALSWALYYSPQLCCGERTPLKAGMT